MFYWKANKDLPALAPSKLASLGVVIVIIIVSLLGIIDFIRTKTQA